jgi:hypothetical protein
MAACLYDLLQARTDFSFQFCTCCLLFWDSIWTNINQVKSVMSPIAVWHSFNSFLYLMIGFFVLTDFV